MLYLFEVQIRPGYSVQQYADAWVRASRIIQAATGARGTRLHRKIGESDRLLAIARWASKADRDAMEQQHDQEVAQIIASQAEFVQIHPIGEFEDAEWVVMPPSRAGEPAMPERGKR